MCLGTTACQSNRVLCTTAGPYECTHAVGFKLSLHRYCEQADHAIHYANDDQLTCRYNRVREEAKDDRWAKGYATHACSPQVVRRFAKSLDAEAGDAGGSVSHVSSVYPSKIAAAFSLTESSAQPLLPAAYVNITMIGIPLYNFSSRLCVTYTAKPSVAATTTIATATTPTSTTAPTSTNPTGAPCDGIDPQKEPCCKLSDKTEQAKCLGEMTAFRRVVSQSFRMFSSC